MKKNKWLNIGIALVAGIVVFMELGWHFFSIMVICRRKQDSGIDPVKKKWFNLSQMKYNHPRAKYEKKYEEGRQWCLQQNMESHVIESEDHLKLHAGYLKAKDESKRIVILCHGYRGSGASDFANIARFLHENNCDYLMIDQRCCGQSEGKYITFGAKEKSDICQWVYYICENNKRHLPVYLFGVSMGAASVLMASGNYLPYDVKGIVADCGFTSMKSQMQDITTQWFHIKYPGLLLFRLDLFCRFFAKFKMSDADATKAIEQNKRPILFFHGEEDSYVKVENTIRNYLNSRSSKDIVLVPLGRHRWSAYMAEETYRRKIMEFFENNEK